MTESTRFNKGLLTAEKMDELEGSTSSSRTKTRYAGTAKHYDSSVRERSNTEYGRIGT